MAAEFSMVPRSTPPLTRRGRTWRTRGARCSDDLGGTLASAAVMMADVDMDPIATPSGEPRQQPQIVTREDGATIAYHRLAGNSPGIVFLGGFMSDMTRPNATALAALCPDRRRAFLRLDEF